MESADQSYYLLTNNTIVLIQRINSRGKNLMWLKKTDCSFEITMLSKSIDKQNSE